jgi:hypothetical protein
MSRAESWAARSKFAPSTNPFGKDNYCHLPKFIGRASSELTIDGTCLLKGAPYANGEAIAEIDQNDNIYELHNDHLGSPRYITAGNAQPNVAMGRIAGEQTFGPYGDEMRCTFNGQALPSGYAPLTGYTGHLN